MFFFYSQIGCKQDNGAKQMVCNRKFKSKIMACVWRKPRCSVLIQYFGFSPGLNRKKIFFPLILFVPGTTGTKYFCINNLLIKNKKF